MNCFPTLGPSASAHLSLSLRLKTSGELCKELGEEAIRVGGLECVCIRERKRLTGKRE